MNRLILDCPWRKMLIQGLFWLCLAAVVLPPAGCKPTREEKPSETPQSPNTAPLPAEPNRQTGLTSEPNSPTPAAVQPAIPIEAVVERISVGDFDGAKQVCQSLDGADPRVAQFSNVMLRYNELQKKRDQKRRAAFDEQLKELDTLREKVKDGVFDANQIDKTFAAAVRAREYADDDKKEAILSDPFVRRAINQAEQTALDDEKAGKWIDAYAHYYYWMAILYEDEKTYTDKAEQLTEMASIELSLKKSDCGETAIERYQDIEPFMFIRALQALDQQYVHPIQYRELHNKAIERCRLLCRVLIDSKEELGWRIDPNMQDDWLSALDAMEYDVEDANSKPLELQNLVELFNDVLNLNEGTLKLPEEVVIAHFSEAALSALDPFTNIVWPWNVKDFEKSMTQQFSGIGVEISKAAGAIKIGSLLPDTPAYRAGLDAEDEILSVNGESTEKMTIFCAVEKITGPKGTKVNLTIRRPATGKTWDVTIVRDKIVVQPLRGWQRSKDGQWDWMIDPANRISYIRLTTFTETSGPDLDATLKKLEENGGLNGVILDLRYNPGGYLQSAAEVADLFVKEGVIVKSTPRQGSSNYEIAKPKGTHPDYPLVILINESSASASEIVAGALQDPIHHRAILVGERSYGKGSVQVVSGYSGGGSQMKYTVAYYHLPGDQQVKNRYQMEKLGRKDWGIAPDVEVKINTSELKEMIEMQRDNDVLVQADHDPNTLTKHSTLAQTLDSDPQLAVGLFVLQSKLIGAGRDLQLPTDPNAIVLKLD